MHNIYNATAAVAVGNILGMSFEGMADAIKVFRGVQGDFRLSEM
jgi:UDP-N-acetylmuramate--alanine ligase